MDDDILNNPNIVRGDVLGSNVDQELLAFNVAKIQQSSESIDKNIESIDRALFELTKDLKDMNKDNFRSSAQDKVDKKSSKSDNDSFKSSTKKKSKSGIDTKGNSIGDLLDGIEEGIAEALGVPYLGDNIGDAFNNIKDQFLGALAKSVGVPAEDAMKEIGKSLVQTKFDKLSDDSLIKKGFDKYKNSIQEEKIKSHALLKDALQQGINATDDPELKKSLGENFGPLIDDMFGMGKPKVKSQDEAENDVNVDKGTGLGAIDLGEVNILWDPLFDYLDSKFEAFDNFNLEDQISEAFESGKEDVPQESDFAKDEINSWIEKLEGEYKNNPQDYSKKEKGGLNDLKNQLKEGNVDQISKDTINNLKSGDIKGTLNSFLGKGGKTAGTAAKTAGTAAKTAGNAAKTAGTVAKTAGTAAKTAQAAGAMGNLAKAGLTAAKGLLKTNAAGIAVSVGLMVLEKAAGPMIAAIGNAFDKFSKLGEKADEVANRYAQSQEKRLKEEQKRKMDDMTTFIRQPFKIMEDSAKRVYDAWEQTIGIINQTQGYDKAGLQDLMTAYAERLKSEGLESAVGTTDVTNMLKSILEKGLSGAVAEEFAYISTVLQKAFPTQDFTGYAESYASMVSQYISQGYAQSEAIQKASQELQAFVNNTASASRAAGGLETGLNDATTLFTNVAKISQLANMQDTSQLSSALATVQSITGQYAGVGTSIVDRIVEAAINGNDQSLVALRSLSGTGASNTAFLRALTDNPNSVLAKMFANLGSMIDKTSDNYMEVAHSLSDTFGVSAQALVQVDWNKVSNSLTSSTTANALKENMELLKSGESTYSAEAQRMQQINEMMIDQGLAYVLDNEAAREIQQHMWDQEIAEEMREATYGVELQGASLEAISALKDAVMGIWKFVTLQWFDGLAEQAIANAEADALKADLKQLIELGKVGNGNTQAFHDLTTYDVKQLTKPKNLMEMWGASSSYYSVHEAGEAWRESKNNLDTAVGNVFGATPAGMFASAAGKLADAASGLLGSGTSAPTSKYTWGAGKSSATLLSNMSPLQIAIPTNIGVSSSENAELNIRNKVIDNLNNWMGTMEDAINEGKSFDDWYGTAANYGIQDAEAALKENGKNVSEIESAFASKSTEQAIENQKERNAKEEQFWEEGQIFWKETFPTDFEQWCVTYDERMNQWENTFVTTEEDMKAFLDQKYVEFITFYTEQASLMLQATQSINENFSTHFVDDYLKEWKDYYIGNHTAYYDAIGQSATELAKTANREKSSTGESVLALAKAITESGSEFADPQLQTNALLSQILIVLEAIMQASNSSGGGFTLSTALSGLGLGGAVDTAVGAVTGAANAYVNTVGSVASGAADLAGKAATAYVDGVKNLMGV